MAHSVTELTVPLQDRESCRKYKVEDEGREGETEKGVDRDTEDSNSWITSAGKAGWACPAKLSNRCFSQRRLWIERVIVVLMIVIIWALLAVRYPSIYRMRFVVTKRLGDDVRGRGGVVSRCQPSSRQRDYRLRDTHAEKLVW